MKKLLILIVVLLALPGYAKTIPAVGSVDGSILHTMQTRWAIAATENSGDTQTDALSKDGERTYKQVVALIAADASNEAHIDIFTLPSEWNSVRFRDINVTQDSGSVVDEIYFGTLGGGDDCDLTYVGQLTWTTGDQDSMYHQIAFTSGGTYDPRVGDVVTGNASDETAVVVSKTLTSGAWADGDAAGTITYTSETGTFTSSETVKITDYLGVTQADVLTHTGSNLVQFEYADTLVIVAKAWGSSWSVVSPADDTIAEAEIDKKGADIMVVVTSTCTADSKLLINGY